MSSRESCRKAQGDKVLVGDTLSFIWKALKLTGSGVQEDSGLMSSNSWEFWHRLRTIEARVGDCLKFSIKGHCADRIGGYGQAG